MTKFKFDLLKVPPPTPPTPQEKRNTRGGARVTVAGLSHSVNVFKDALSLFAGMLSKKQVHLVYRGTECSTNGSVITLPDLGLLDVPEDADEERIQRAAIFLDNIRGFVAHEVGHVLFTDFEAAKKEITHDNDLRVVWNFVEDCFIEKRMSAYYPGTTGDFAFTHDWALRKAAENWHKVNDFSKIMLSVSEIAHNDFKPGWWTQGQCSETKKWLKKLTVPILAIKKAQSTKDCLKIAKEIMAVLLTSQETPEEQKETEDDDQKDFENSQKEPKDDLGDVEGSEDESDEEDGNDAEESENEEDDEEESEDGLTDEERELFAVLGDNQNDDEEDEDEEDDEEESEDDPKDDPKDDLADFWDTFENDPEEEKDSEDAEEGSFGIDPEDNAGLGGSKQEDAPEDANLDGPEENLESSVNTDISSDLLREYLEEEAEALQGNHRNERQSRQGVRKYRIYSEAQDISGDAITAYKILSGKKDIPASELQAMENVPLWYHRKGFNPHTIGLTWDVFKKELRIAEYNRVVDSMNAEISVFKRKMRGQLTAMSRPRNIRDLHEGDLDTGNLYRVALPSHIPERARLFKRQELVEGGKELCVGLLINQSGSMYGPRMTETIRTTIMFGEVLSSMNIPFTIVGHCALGSPYSVSRFDPKNPELTHELPRTEDEDLYDRFGALWWARYKKFDEPFRPVRDKLATLTALGGTYDGEALNRLARELKARKEKRKLIFTMDDGAPQSAEYRKTKKHVQYLKDTVIDVEKAGIELFCLSIQTSAGGLFYKNTSVIHSVKDVPIVAGTVLKEQLMRSLKRK